MSTSGSGLTRITTDAAYDGTPAWSGAADAGSAMAVVQAPGGSGVPIDLNGDGLCEDANGNGMTNLDGVFAAGDAGSGPSLVVRAIASGRNAARGIMEYLSRMTP